MRFHAVLELNGKTATGIEVPRDVVESLGSGRRPPVRVTINRHTYRSTVASRGGRFLLPVSSEIRREAGVAAGDEVDVDIELDDGPRRVTVPPDFGQALDAEPEAKRIFETMPYSHQLRYVLSIEEAKTAQTRQRRITKAVNMLREGRP
jgi:bifunctional DNA-binding transcriptional regulator/antitoxin component of YhaV-PrlF toxin-antitoxin module